MPGPERLPTARRPARRRQDDRLAILRALEGIGAETLGCIAEADETFQRESRNGSREWVRPERDTRRNQTRPRPRWQDFRRLGLPLTTGPSRWPSPILAPNDRAGAHRADRLPDRRAESLVAVLRPSHEDPVGLHRLVHRKTR